MKLLFVITKAEVGGAQQHLLTLLRGLKEISHNIVVCGSDGYLGRCIRSDNLAEFHVVPTLRNSLNPLYAIITIWKLCELIAALKPDIIHGHSSVAGLVARLAATISRTTSVYTIHGLPYGSGLPPHRSIIAYLTESIFTLIPHNRVFVSKADYDRRTVGFRRTFDVVIPNGIDAPRAAIRTERDYVHVVTVARLAPPKRVDILIRAMAELPDTFKLTIVGDGPFRQRLQELTHALHLTERVNFVGETEQTNVFYESADVFALCSTHEGLPISIIEAMSFGTAVLTAAVGGACELVRHGETGYVVDDYLNPQRWTHYLELLLDGRLRKTLASNARRLFLKSYDAKHCVSTTLALYRFLSRAQESICRPSV